MLTPVATPAAPFELVRTYALDIARSVGRIAFKNGRCTRDVGYSEYNAGQWGRVFPKRVWLEELTLESFLTGQDDRVQMAMGFAPSLHNDGLLYVWEPIV